MRRKRVLAFTLIELIVVILIVFIIVSVAFMMRPRIVVCGGFSRPLVCASNLKGIGTSMKIYANEHDGAWPVPAFDETMIGRIDYTVRVGGGEGSVRSPDRTQPSIGGRGGTRQLSVTRAFWMLVRTGDVTVDQFICPASGDTAEVRSEPGWIDLYYDFAGYNHISYGFQVPFGPPGTRAHERMDSRMPLAAEKGPYVTADVSAPPPGLPLPAGRSSRYGAPRSPAWEPFNSRNHGGEGQNVLFADGHASFKRTPVTGVGGDNIYTVALDNWSQRGRSSGESPWECSAHPYFPRVCSDAFVSTDTVIYP